MNKEFETVAWARQTNIYEVNVRQYTEEGSFKAFLLHLPRLKDMGVEVLWFMPVHPIGVVKRLGTLGSYYSIKDYKAVNPEFGTLDDFKELVTVAKKAGFKVIIDWVANHTSWDHIWTREHPEFFERDHWGNFKSPYDWADVIQLDHGSNQQQDAMIEAMKFWIDECGIDGFRCDMAHLVPLAFWRRARRELEVRGPLFWLGETEEAAYHDVFDVSYAWQFLHKMEQYWRRETDIAGLEEVLSRYNDQFPVDAIRAFFTSNHDENSHSGSEYERMGDAAKTFAVLCATLNGIPLIYSGQELPNKKRLKFFDKDCIEWTPDCALHVFYKTLLRLRVEHTALEAATSEAMIHRIKTTDARIFSFSRIKATDQMLIFANLSAERIDFRLQEARADSNYRDVFTNGEVELSTHTTLTLEPWGFLVIGKK